MDEFDLCINGEFGWNSGPITDWDHDGCRDISEDDDDDNDGYLDEDDQCPRSLSPEIVDGDFDGCDDRNEDFDLDNDGILTSDDNCETNPSPGWISTLSSDRDRDGCADSTEDDDDDGDGVLDIYDECALSARITIDHDMDGCMDEYDLDDDNDGVADIHDQCAHGALGWTSTKKNDIDGDGCWDSVEDKSLPRGIIETISNSPIMMGVLAALALLVLVGATLQTRGRIGRESRARDGTREVIASMTNSEDEMWGVKSETITPNLKRNNSNDENYQNLVETGYSPEVARAIIASESALRDSSTE